MNKMKIYLVVYLKNVFIELKRRGYDVFIMQIRRSATLLLERA